MMKIFLLLTISSVVAAGVLPGLPAKIALCAVALLAALIHAARSAPTGCEDADGFRFVPS